MACMASAARIKLSHWPIDWLTVSNVCYSSYCLQEFNIALHHNIVVKRKKRLIVLMALDSPTDLQANEASETLALRQYLRQYTYIDYTADDWLDKLLYALPLHGMDRANRAEQEHANCNDADDVGLMLQ